MSFLQNRQKKRKKVFIIGIIIFVISTFFWGDYIFTTLSKGIQVISRPILKAGNNTRESTSSLSYFFETKKELYEENVVLKKELLKARIELLSMDLLTQENMELEEMLGRKQQRDFVLASVLSKPSRSPYDTILVDIGRESGVKKGGQVMAGNNIIIGYVSEVFSKTAKVVLYSSFGEEIDVFVGFENISAIAKGVGSGNYSIRLPRGIGIEEGDSVSSPSRDIKLLGIVEEIISESNNSFQTILFKMPINITKLKWVGILQNL